PRPRMREMARAATEANRERVGGRRVTLRFDVERRDRYGRLLAYVFVGDTLVNEWLVRRGYARAGRYPPNLRHDERLQAAEDAARAEDLRIWDGRLDGRPFRPDGGRRR
ncbi:MAG: thermonuclease family protein, partial [Gemmatimonadota bacterium]